MRTDVWPAVTLVIAGCVGLAGCAGGDGGDGGGAARVAPPAETVLAGRVVSRGTRGPLGDVRVAILDGPNAGRTGATGSDGRFRIGSLVPGGFTAQASVAGFEDARQPVTLAGGQSADVDFRMARAACPQASCDLAPSDCNETLPFFQAPLDGTPWTSNLFDHQYPRSFSDPDSAFLSYCGGGNRAGGINGHGGYDWVVPVGTPLLAVADGTISFAGAERSFFCPLLNREVAGLWMQLETRSAHGERFWVQYAHLSQLLAVAGQAVRVGETIGLSGNTGCSTGPHLHIQVLREFTNQERDFGGTSAALLDPYGWQGKGKDPWANEPEGAPSVWLWIQPPRLSRLPVPSPDATPEPAVRDMNNIPRPSIPR